MKQFTSQESLPRNIALKVVPRTTLERSKAKQKLKSEIAIHRSLMHAKGEGSEYCVRFERSFEDADNVYIVVELCHNQSLNELIKRRKKLTEIEAQCYIRQLIKATEFLHGKRIIHRE